MSIVILPFTPERATHFDRLNRAWITQYFCVEAFDDKVLKNPEEMILSKGGEIWFAQHNDEIVGVCALLYYAEGVFELTKLAVDPSAQGLGVAKALMLHCHERAKEKGAHTLKIFTNTRLIPANSLYVKLGYKEITLSEEERARYARCDIIYELPL